MAGLRKVDVRDYLLRTLGIESSANANAGMLADVLAAMNYANQTLWTAGPDYFTRAQIAVTLIAGTASYTLANTIQSVLGPMKLPSGRTLRPLESRAELDNFGLLYLGQTEAGVDEGVPLAYFIESLNQTGNDPVLLKLHVVPAPSAAEAGAATLDGVSECTIFASTDLAATDVLPVAQQYVESLFLPIARKHVAGSTYFSAANLLKGIEADFDAAMGTLRRAGGFPPAAGRKESRETEA